MADYYEEWSTTLSGLNEEEAEWMRNTIDQIAAAVDDPVDGPQFLLEHVDPEDLDAVPSVVVSLPDPLYDVWFHSDGYSGDRLEVQAAIMKEFFRLFRPDQAHVIHWSAGCSRPINDAFGGGCAVVTANEIHYMTTWDWADKKLGELDHGKKESGDV